MYSIGRSEVLRQVRKPQGRNTHRVAFAAGNDLVVDLKFSLTRKKQLWVFVLPMRAVKGHRPVSHCLASGKGLAPLTVVDLTISAGGFGRVARLDRLAARSLDACPKIDVRCVATTALGGFSIARSGIRVADSEAAHRLLFGEKFTLQVIDTSVPVGM